MVAVLAVVAVAVVVVAAAVVVVVVVVKQQLARRPPKGRCMAPPREELLAHRSLAARWSALQAAEFVVVVAWSPPTAVAVLVCEASLLLLSFWPPQFAQGLQALY